MIPRLYLKVCCIVVASMGTAAGSLAEQGQISSAKPTDGLRVTEGQLRQIKVVTVDTRVFRHEHVAIGTLSYNEDAVTPVHTPFSGRVTRLLANLGETVSQGAPLCEISSPEVVQIHNELLAAVNTHAKTSDRLAHLGRVLDRQVALLAGRATTARDVEAARSDKEQGEAELKAAAGALSAARNRFEVLLGRSAADREKAEHENSINSLITIKAPIGGTIIARKVGPGQYVKNEAGEILFSIADLSTVWLKMSVPESKVQFVRIGDAIEFTVSAYPGKPMQARVTAISSLLDAGTRRVVVRSEVPNANRALKAEMFASGRILTGAGEPSPAVPAEAVIREGDVASVWVQNGPSEFKRRLVELGLENEGQLQIRKGLVAGEKVVVRGAIFLDNELRQ